MLSLFDTEPLYSQPSNLLCYGNHRQKNSSPIESVYVILLAAVAIPIYSYTEFRQHAIGTM